MAVVAASMLLAGCGSDEPEQAGASVPPPAKSTPLDETPTEDLEDGATRLAPTAQGRASGRRLDALVAAYRPISSRINFVVTAETMREDAEATGEDEAVELERAGTVRLESERMLAVIRAVRPRVVAATVATGTERQVQARMIAAIDARSRAMRALQRLLTAKGAVEVDDEAVERLQSQWRTQWEASIRNARDATTLMQDARQQFGLDAAAEEGIR